jgi:cell division protein FtsI/penicillin-binding protein 2
LGASTHRRSARQSRGLRHGLPLLILAVAAFIAGVIVASSSGADVRAVVVRYVHDWTGHELGRMYMLLDPASKRKISEKQFISQYQGAAQTATTRTLTVRRVGNPNGKVVPVTMVVHTGAFGTLRETLLVPYDENTSEPTIRYADTLLFPGLRPGELLSRSVSLPPRATLLARNGVPLAEGPDRTSPISSVASGIVGSLGPIPPDLVSTFVAEGYPPDAKVGLDGLERVFQSQLAGKPGGTLRAGMRVLAQTRPVPGKAVKTTIDPNIEAAAITALGSNYGGIVAMDPRTGQLLALAGLAFSAVQPPGSTMKIVTTTGALQAGIVKPTDSFPIATSAVIGGYTLNNASGEACGGTLVNAFAVSCNSVFAPLGVRLGGQRLVATAERFGFNHEVPIPGATESTIPPANQIGNATDVGSSAIGQGKVQASTLEMTDVAATIADGGRRPVPTLSADQRPQFVHVTGSRVANEVQQMMIAVVQYGTGTAAAIPGVTVAGKTGTAEIGNSTASTATDPNNADAWFVGYAPVGAPKIVAGALFANQGFGGLTAAPAVRQVLEAGLAGH